MIMVPLRVAALLCALVLTAASPAPLTPEEATLRSHVAFLAGDELKGREAGSPEYDIAARYVAAQFEAAGLKPAGDAGGYLQRVPLVRYRLTGPGRATLGGRALKFGRDYVPLPNPAAANTRMTAPVVFVGYGIVAPGYARDDYAGVDVRGKIVAFVGGAPTTMTGEERAYFGSSDTKATIAAAHGAIGAVLLATPKSEKARPFAKTAERYAAERMTWANPDGTGHPAAPVPVLARFGLLGSAKLFDGAAVRWTDVAAEADKPEARFRSTALAKPLSIASATAFVAARSSNVVGIIPGSDPALSRETVVLSAHLDHIGVSDTPDAKGDAINNGALDDAIGIASLIEEAKRFAASGKPPRRSVMFLAVTAEEKGLVGSDYFVAHLPRSAVPNGGGTGPLPHPTSHSEYAAMGGGVGERAGAASAQADQIIVADVNLDMPILTYRFEDMVAFGGDRSTLGPVIRRAMKAVGVVVSPDPIPDEGIFVRSDHFNFVRAGVPSVFLWPGHKGPGKAATEDFLANRYHKPGDDMSQPILWNQGVRFVDANYRIAREIADADARPVWNRGDYFGTTFAGPMAK